MGHMGRRRAGGRARLLVACVVALAALTGGLAWAAAGGGSRQNPAPGSRTYTVELALLRKVASPGGGWAQLRTGSVPASESPVAVAVWTGEAGVRVPDDFLGLSFESTTLSELPGIVQGGTLSRLLSSLGKGTLRFGGGTVNRYVAWEQPGSPAPSWATHPVSAADFQALASVTHRTGWKVLLTMNLAHYNPVAVKQEAAAASKELQGSLAGIAIGNEPNSFERFGLRSAGWDFSEYANQLAGYRGAVAAGAPGAQIAAPDASTGEEPLPWVWESIGLHPTVLTDHYYPLTRCGHKPTITQMLSPEVRLEETVMLSTLGDIQRTARTPLELDETNDVSCKGEPGVSNAFASALWAADYIARAMRSGLRGVDFHDLPELPLSYSPLVGEGSALHANPEWYALLLTHALQGTSVLPTAVGSGTDLTAQGFLGADGSVELLLVNFAPVGTKPLPVALQLHGHASAQGTILRLTGPSEGATAGVELGGEEVSASGSWKPKLPLPGVSEHNGAMSLSMPAASAALVTIPPP
jgi:hypothetical protein